MDYVRKLSEIELAKRGAPVDVEALVKKLGLVLKEAYLEDNISGMIEAEDDQYTITINETHGEKRKRFTIAHELGHYMLHEDLIGSGLDDNAVYRSTNEGRYSNYKVGPQEEREANRFAAELLMPYRLVSNSIKEKQSVADMATRFNVSEAAMTIRKKHVEAMMRLKGSE